jgi:hypothetical protein
MDLDDNPNTFKADNHTIFIQNSNGKLLWKRNMELGDHTIGSPSHMRSRILLIDIDNDKKTEVILTGENNGFQRCYDVKCYNYDGSLRWNYFFRDSVFSDREYLSRAYSSSIIDTITLNNELYIALSAANNNSFSSAIYFINIRNAKREYGTFWASGHIVGAIIKDINRDGIRDVLGIGFDNGYEDGVLFGFKIDTYNKVRLTTPEYLIRNYPVANLITYLRVKKTDYDILNGGRMPPIGGNSLRYENNEKHYYFGMPFTEYTKFSKIEYSATENFIIDDITIASNFRILRDTLVAHGTLEPPYTDTKEFKKLIMDNILYWKNGKWLNRKGVEKK